MGGAGLQYTAGRSRFGPKLGPDSGPVLSVEDGQPLLRAAKVANGAQRRRRLGHAQA